MIKIKIDSRQINEALESLQKKTNDMNSVLDEIGQYIESEIALNFRDASDSYGNAWKELKYRVGKPLNDTGRLRNSITHNVSGNSVEIGTNVEYAGKHQTGENRIPARPFLPTEERGLPDEWAQEVVDIIASYLKPSRKTI